MENASKALIIAGAILISILLISIGILVMNSTNGVTDTMTGQMDATAIQSFNSKFEQYAGNNKRGSDVKSLISVVSSSNAANQDNPDMQVLINGVSDQAALSTLQNDVKSTARYNITVVRDDITGLVHTIEFNTSSGGTGGSTGGTGSTPTL